VTGGGGGGGGGVWSRAYLLRNNYLRAALHSSQLFLMLELGTPDLADPTQPLAGYLLVCQQRARPVGLFSRRYINVALGASTPAPTHALNTRTYHMHAY
jgi:hypothetical protein